MFAKIKSTLKDNSFKLYTRPFELNILGVRAKSIIPDRFDDELYVFYKTTKGKWHVHLYKITTDPGTFWLANPEIPQGTAILRQGQYENAYALGLHRGQYKALVQVKPVTIIRDYNRNGLLDFNNGIPVTGLFGVNIHHAKKEGITYQVDRHSAGCQVFQDIADFTEFMTLCELHSRLYGNQFTYTLIDKRTIERTVLRRVLYAASFVTTLLAGFIIKRRYRKKKKGSKPKARTTI